MRIPVPERIKVRYALGFAFVLFVVQQLEGTELTFSGLCATFVVLSCIAFNLGGGLVWPSGAWVFFNALSTGLLGMTYKCFLGERGESHLDSPQLTMMVYCGGMAGVAVAVFLSQKLRRRHPLLGKAMTGNSMQKAAIGCLIFGILLQLLTGNETTSTASITSALRQINQFMRMAVILATSYEILRSHGEKSTNWVVWLGGAATFFAYGIVGFSKEGMFIGIVAWAIPCIALGYNFRIRQFVLLGVAVFFIVQYLVPYSQYGRRSRDEGGSQLLNLEAALSYLTDLEGTRQLYLAEVADAPYQDGPHFYNEQQGLFDREQMIAYDDALITNTEDRGAFGLTPVLLSYANVVPHFLWKDKPTFSAGNEYGRELGVLASDDDSTGISFSPVGDAYHEAKWFGVLVVLPVVVFLYGFVMNSLTGSIRESPWALLPIALSSHAAPQGLMDATIYITTYGAVAVVAIALMSRYVFPPLVNFVTGTMRPKWTPTLNFRPGVQNGVAPVRPTIEG